jgi:hypothetical protein
MTNAHKTFTGKPEGKRPLGRPRRRWDNNIRIYLREIGCKCADCIHLPQAVVNKEINLRFP